jgi:hypothetical protein
VQDKIAQQKELSFANMFHTLTWGQIEKDLEQEIKERERRTKQLISQSNDLLKQMGEVQYSLKDLKEELTKPKYLLDEAIKQEGNWRAQVALFRGTIHLIFQDSKDGKLDTVKLQADKDKVCNQEIEIREKDSEGKLTYKTKKVGDILDCKDLVPLLKNYTSFIFNPGKPPGLTVTILSLAVDLAKAELDRTRLKVNYLEALIETLETEKEGLGSGYAEKALNILQGRIEEGTILRNETVLATFDRLRKQPRKEKAIKGCSRVIAYYAITKTLEESAVLQSQSKPAILAHEYSIRLSAINSREHEALIARGLEGLAIYHAGGIKPEMIANFLRAAQTAALAVIGAGVL